MFHVIAHPFVFGRNCTSPRAVLIDPGDKPQVSRFGGPDWDQERFLREKCAFEGFASGPFSSRAEAERACTALLATGKFFKVTIREEVACRES